MQFAVVMDRDGNRGHISSNEAFKLESTWTFVTGTTGATGAHTLFTVTGNVLATVFGVCDTNLTGAATIEVGVASNTAQLLAQIANATTLDDGDVYVDADTEVGAGLIPAMQVLNDGTDIIMTIGSTAVTAGVVDWYCLWRPLSSNGLIEVTTPA
ncbi:MAG: hypothetical protein A2Z42_04250 [Candidatus Woykebacteria bacterium RBG_19FT_COMBO_43_10]|uniref:Uncharacterized protein n=1 Tax=Candidatus Woykebacteria bacterium RBG_19FT_COMBO_43_10 TaxID=1802598 RepID=A0A1G1WJQ0_9BACT|nr:MAG: hypothetical protein A2Z42_04250 [Candidatus Woykebacteria bacterium RBG_19FT_COMBO_43_10]